MNYRLNNIIGLKSRRRELRKRLTPAEARLWKYIKNRQLNNKKFRRQHSLGNYVVDFFCPEWSLIVELDGSPHDTIEGYEKDDQRTRFLLGKGYKIIRFENKEVMNNLEGVLLEIKKFLI